MTTSSLTRWTTTSTTSPSPPAVVASKREDSVPSPTAGRTGRHVDGRLRRYDTCVNLRGVRGTAAVLPLPRGDRRRRRTAAATLTPRSSVRAAAAAEESTSTSTSTSASSSSSSSSSSSAELAAAELVAQVTKENGLPNDNRVVELISELEDARCLSTSAAFVGPWEVVWSEGTMAWRALVARAVQAVAGKSRAGQWFTLGDASSTSAPEALNFAELFAGLVIITAWGVFRPKPTCADAEDPDKLAQGASYPLGFDVQIAGGDIRVAGRRWKLPICGPGEFEVLYGDESVRVFRSSGGIAVQVPSDWKKPPE